MGDSLVVFFDNTKMTYEMLIHNEKKNCLDIFLHQVLLCVILTKNDTDYLILQAFNFYNKQHGVGIMNLYIVL